MNTSRIWFTNPDVIWSGVIASALAFGGVILTIWINARNIGRQLEHDAKERDNERKADLRKEVYLTAAEEITKVHSFFSTLPQADLSNPAQAGGLNGFFSAAAKLQLVCEPDTALYVGELVGVYGGLLLRLLIKVNPLHTLRSDIAIRTDQLNRYQAEVSRVLAAMTELNESGNHDSDRFKALQRSFDYNQRQSNLLNEERNALFDQQNELNATYSREIVIELKNVLPVQMKVMAAIREEFNLGNNPDLALRQAEAHLKQASAQLDGLLAHLGVGSSGEVEQ